LNTQTIKTINYDGDKLKRIKDFKIEIRVRYSETDMSGLPHHSNYFVWVEETRMALLRELGLSYRVMEEEGVFIPIEEASCRLLSPVKMDDIIEIYPKIEKANRRFIKISYIIYSQEKKNKIAEAATINVVVNSNGMAISLPNKYLDLQTTLQNIQESQVIN
jgi:acyl-CoA thioester hydrolase